MVNPKTKIEITAVDKTKAAFASVQRNIGSVDKSMGSLMATIGSAAAVGALARMVTKTIDLGDKMQKLSLRLGLTTEYLSEMRYVAESTGVGFDTFAMAIQRMERRLGQLAATGKGEAKEALDQLGMSISDLAGLSGAEQLDKLADAISGVDDQQQKLFIAMKLFDSEGVRMLQMLEDGAAGMDEMRRKAADLGVTIDSLDAIKLENLKQQVTDLGFAWEGFANTLTMSVEPAITGVLNLLAEGLQGFSDFQRQAENYRRGIDAAIGVPANEGDFDFVGPGSSLNVPDAPERTPWTPPTSTAAGGASKSGGRGGKSEAQKMAEDFDKLRESLFPLVKLENDYYKNLTLINQAMDMAGGSTTVYDEALAELTTQFEEAEAAAKVAAGSMVDWQRLMDDAIGDLASGMADTLVDAFMTGELAFEDFAKSFLADIAKMIIQAQILAALSAATGGGSSIGSLIGSLIGIKSADGNVFSGGNVIPFAKGGALIDRPTLFPMANGATGIAGEAGTEAIFPLTRIGGKLGIDASGVGGVVVNNTVVNNSSAKVTQSEETDSMGNVNIVTIIEDVMGKALSNGRMDRVMMGNYGTKRVAMG